jgi:hypothetical protein
LRIGDAPLQNDFLRQHGERREKKRQKHNESRDLGSGQLL